MLWSLRGLDATALLAATAAGLALHLIAPLALAPAMLAAAATLALRPAFGGYDMASGRSPVLALGGLLALVAAVNLPLAALCMAVQPRTLASAPAWSALDLAALCATQLLGSLTLAQLRRQGRLTPNIVVVGATAQAARLIETVLETREVAVLGVFDDRSNRIGPNLHGVPVLGDTAALANHRILPYVDRIVLTVNAAGPARTAELIERLRPLPNDLCLLLDGDDARGRSTTLSWLARSTLSLSGPRAQGGREFAKRMQDLALGLLLLIPALPVMALVALAVRLDSPGPILFRQRRHGFNNEEILVWKFRSMRTDAADQGGSRQVGRDDDRVTRVGRFIRKTSLDELPQFFNVLQGRMSLVGPRPHPVAMKTAGEDSARLVSEYAWRHRMKPGITGWAQIHGSRGPVHTAEEVRQRVELDVDYIERQSFWLDLYVILMTAPCLLGDRQAIR